MPPLRLKYVDKLAGQRVFVLGGASGIGFAVASGALGHGATVLVSSSNPDRIKNVIKKLKDAYPDPYYHARNAEYPCDILNSDTVQQNLISLLDKSTKNRTAPIDHIAVTAGDRVTYLPSRESRSTTSEISAICSGLRLSSWPTWPRNT